MPALLSKEGLFNNVPVNAIRESLLDHEVPELCTLTISYVLERALEKFANVETPLDSV